MTTQDMLELAGCIDAEAYKLRAQATPSEEQP